MPAFADYDLWRWTPHPEVWLIVLAALAVGTYVVRVLAPVAGEAVGHRQKGYYLAAVAFLWLASDWPVHDIAEQHLYSVHMVQHLLITFVVPPLLLLATPEWLARRVVDPARPVARRLLRPIVVGVVFNVVVAITHLPWVVNTSAGNGIFHYTAHLLLFVTAIAMWLPVCGPFPELRLQPLAKMFYLFAMSVLPTVPAGFLTFAQSTLYEAYDTPLRLWGVTVANDQQMAGLIMKIVGGLYLWTIIAGIFFHWSARQRAAEREGEPAAQPAEHLAAQPAEHLAAQPAEHLAAQPAEHLAAQPAEHLAAQPAEHLAAQPVPQPASAAPEALTYSQVVEASRQAGDPPAEHAD